MGGLILIFLMIAWPLAAFFIARTIFKDSQRHRQKKIAAVALAIALAPVAEELYIISTFSFYCWQYAGITKLNPVAASAIEIDSPLYWSSTRILEHPAISTVKTTNNPNKYLGGSTIWLSKKKGSSCQDPIHYFLVNAEVMAARILPKKVEKEGYCYASAPLTKDPDIFVGETDWQRSSSIFFPFISDVMEQRFSVVRKSTSETLSELVLMKAEPGVIRRSVWPYYSSYRCPAPKRTGGEYVFPFKENTYRFLEKSIDGKEK